MTVKISISISDQQAAYARKQVEEGRFASTSAVIQQALEERRREDEAHEEERRAFFDMLRERARGPFLPAEESDRRFEEMMARKRKEFGLDD